ncbi:ABC transporter permease/substrate-binding protein [Enterococcus pseudoavium]|uniref:ABC transporter permease/substrate-binding protein n=1 Tax=Enterococcus pseudoavium TaxID=44007 RepID=A0ABU3FIK9_9ENTE|nr:ABC transporter permease/substrate-binding protein [Enterococcus pseudoavium]MDT2755018.1 ABC transporter permease/substrate-binding protein [Enterococcus pseudoavium]MDT2770901.1 ABC transporter permease/substrate-binding protein [Enterococcus pseudoavium]
MNELIHTFNERKADLLTAILEHLAISLSALLIAVVIAIPLAILLSQRKKLAEVVLQITSILQTIPSLALLGLLIPFVGIGTVPALIALVVYALLPIFQNTYIGLSEIDPSIEEAADAFGMSRMRKLVRVELPMAMPVIISGVRTAAVLIIGTATLAALIGAGGLGTFILLGIDRNDPSLTLIGAISSALLAIIFSTLIRFLQNRSGKTTLIVLGVIGLSIGGIFFVQNNPMEQETVTIAGKLGSEPDILINMYQAVIKEEDPSIKVELKPNFGKTSFLFSAIKSDQIDIYPEFTGTVLESLVKVPENTPDDLSAKKTYQEANKLLSAQFEMRLLKPLAYENTYALAMKKSEAEKRGITKISQLQGQQAQLKAGFTLEFIDRQDGYRGIQEKYGVNLSSVQSMEPALRYQAINNGDVDVIDAYSTDSEIKQYDLVTLADDQHLFPPYQGAPLMKKEFADNHPKVVKALNRLAGKITEDQMIEMNYLVNVKKQQPKKVAHDFLVKEKIIKEGK